MLISSWSLWQTTFHSHRNQAKIWLIMKFKCWLFIYAKCCFGFCLSNTVAGVLKGELQWGNNEKLKSPAVYWNTRANHAKEYFSNQSGRISCPVSLPMLSLNSGASKTITPTLVSNPRALPKAWEAGRYNFTILCPSKLYFLQKQDKRKTHFFNHPVLLRAPLFVNF